MKALRLMVSALFVLGGCSSASDTESLRTPDPAPQPTTQTAESSTASPSPAARHGAPHVIGTIASGLSVPWGIAFLPNGTALVGERDTTRVLAIRGKRVRTVARLEGVQPRGEAGLLGLAVSPSYSSDHLVFAYLSTPQDNRVVQMTYERKRLGEMRPILTGIPNGFIHDGGRLQFGPDGYLYVSTGETGNGRLAQDRRSLAGKILRITPGGKPAPGNPIKGSPVWSMGHRNVQGLAFDKRNRLWATEFGANTWDELNLIRRGRNYGWPVVEGKAKDARYRNPFVQWRTSQASSSGLAFRDGSLWAASLRGQRLWRIPVKQGRAAAVGKVRDYFVGDYGRLRTVVAAPDGNLWVTTSNRDGRGDPRSTDDRILLVSIH